MNDQSESNSSSADAEELATNDGAPKSSQLQCGPLRGCIAAFLGGLLTWGIFQVAFPVFTLPKELADLPYPTPPDKEAELVRFQEIANRGHAILAVAILGVAVGCFLATAEACSRGMCRSATWRGPLGGAVAGLIGAGAGLLGFFLVASLKYVATLSPLAKTITAQSATLGLLGLGIGLGIAIAYRDLRLLLNCALGGILGGVFAAIIYPTCIACLLPVAQTELAIPKDATSQLIWIAATTLLIGFALTGIGKRKKATPGDM